MNIAIFNGDMIGGQSPFTQYARQLARHMESDHRINYFELNSMTIRQCVGCWACWWKTPGLCAIKDDMDSIYKALMQSDFFIFASPLMAGFTSSLLKKMTERLIVLLHPYIIIVQGECHHKKRYDHYPNFGLLLEKEPDTDPQDIQIVTDIYNRFALNFHCQQKYTWSTDQHSLKDISHDTCHI